MLLLKTRSGFAGLLRCVILVVLFTHAEDGAAYSGDVMAEDPTGIKTGPASGIQRNNSKSPDISESYYRADSLFSFASSKGYFPSILDNFAEQATAPLRFSAKDWILTGSAIGVTGILIHYDSDIDEWARVQKQKHGWINRSSPIITNFGANYGVFSVIFTGLASAALQNEKGVQTSLLASQAFITSGVWVRMLKLLTGRERPMADYTYSKIEGGKWYGSLAMYDQDHSPRKTASSFDSFPSGHTASAFAIATVFASQYKDIKIVPVLSYSTATLVGITRLTEHEHWASDVFVGGLIGYLCGKEVVAHNNKLHQLPVDSLSLKGRAKPELSFIQEGNQIGLSVEW